LLEVVIQEMKRLESRSNGRSAHMALKHVNQFSKISYSKGNSVDDSLLFFSIETGAIVATLDKELKKRLKENGLSVLTLMGEKPIII